MSELDKKRGCFYGLAIGDALGAPVEFCKPGTFEEVKDYRGLGIFDLLPGQWTDDTSMALALADSLYYRWSTKDQLSNYVKWYLHGKYSVNGKCFDIGKRTRKALVDFIDTGQLVASYSSHDSEGNGSIMRLAPVPINYLNSEDLIYYLVGSSTTTHSSPVCTWACVVLGLMLQALIEGKPKDEVLDKNFIYSRLNDSYAAGIKPTEPIDEIICGSYKTNTIVGSGHVVKTLEAAIWSFYTSSSFEETVLKAVNLGNDADTVGAVAGQLAGAYYGYNSIPNHLIKGLDRKDLIDTYLNPILDLKAD